MSEPAAGPSGAENVAWDLTDLYAAPDDPVIEQDLAAAVSEAEAVAGHHRGLIASAGADGLADLLARYEAVRERGDKLESYAYLNWASDTTDQAAGALLQKATEHSSRLKQILVFAELEWANLPDEIALPLQSHPGLARYRHWLETTRMRRPYLLSESEEKIIAEKYVTGSRAWARFFDEVHSAKRYDFDGQPRSLEYVLARRYHADRDVRRRAMACVTDGLRDLSRISTYVLNSILADKASDDRLRNYPTWISERNLHNQVDDGTVEALVEAVTSRYDVVARYYGLKRRLLHLDELFEFDMYAPLPAADRRYTWQEARATIREAFESFHPDIADTAESFFDRRWIDAAVRPGKLGGAFSASTVPSVHPYILMNFEGRPRDVMTLAHELGHGVHQALAARQGLLLADTPLTTAETASVFGEMLVFQAMMAAESDPRVRLTMLTAKLEDSFATCFRQISMNRFEDLAHTGRRREGELSTDRLNAMWLEVQQAMFGDSLSLTSDYGLWWSYVPHFIATPGYVYAYAFGELLVLALYGRYQQTGPDFTDAYVNMLAAGGSDWPHELLKPLGVDLTDPEFWHQGLLILAGMVADAEALANQLERT